MTIFGWLDDSELVSHEFIIIAMSKAIEREKNLLKLIFRKELFLFVFIMSFIFLSLLDLS
jgi:hypothetical protein